MFPLAYLNSGEKAEIMEIKVLNFDVLKSVLFQTENMGIVKGKIVEVINNYDKNLLLIKVDGAIIALARSIAMRIIVKKI